MRDFFDRIFDNPGLTLIAIGLSAFILGMAVIGLVYGIQAMVDSIPETAKLWLTTNPLIASLIIFTSICGPFCLIGLIIWLVGRSKRKSPIELVQWPPKNQSIH